MRKPYPKYHPPIDLPYAEVPQGRTWDVYPSPHQRIGKKERRLWGATVSQVPYAYEDPYLTSVQDTQYTVDTSQMHRYPYVRPGEDPGRMPMLFDEPFPAASGSANYLDTFGDEPLFGSDIPFQNRDEGNAFRRWVNDNHPDWAKENELSRSGSHKNSYIKRAWAEFGDEYMSGGKKKGFDVNQALDIGGKIVGFVQGLQKSSAPKRSSSSSSRSSKKIFIPSSSIMRNVGASLSKMNSELSEIKRSPEPQAFSNLFAQIAENEKVNVVQRMQSGQQVPVMVRQTMAMQKELTDRSADLQRSGEKLEKEKKKNNVLLYTSIGGGVTALGLLTYLIFRK